MSGYYGGWLPSDYLTEDLDTTPYENKKGHLYMDFGPWAEEVSGAMKAMAKKMKETKAPYGRVNRRGIFNKIDFWNRLIDLDIDNTPSEKIAALLQGYEPKQISAHPGYAFNGPIGTTANYDAYKALLEAKRGDETEGTSSH